MRSGLSMTPPMTDLKLIEPRGPLSIQVRPPGSKSLTNRALLIAALADGESRLSNPLRSDDTLAMGACLKALGSRITDDGNDLVISGGPFQKPLTQLDVNLSGTALRFLVAAASLVPGGATVDGRQRIRERPIRPLTDALAELGVTVSVDPQTGGAPVVIGGGGLRGGVVRMDASTSSQPVSALMMVAPFATGPVRIEFLGGQSISASYLQTTAEVMAAFGVEPELAVDHVVIPTGRYRPLAYAIEADASAAVYAWCAAAISGGEAVVTGIGAGSSQADLGVLEALAAMGCAVEVGSREIVVRAPRRLTGITMDLGQCPDGAMAIAVCAAFADGPSRLTGLSSWAVKETDRLVAVSTELAKLGVGVVATRDSLSIDPPSFMVPTEIQTYDDHRMAMSFSLAGLRVPGVRIADPEVVSKTWPGYWEEFASWS